MSFASIASPSVVPGEPGDGLTWDLARPWPQPFGRGRFDLVIRAQVRDVGGNTGGGRQGGRSAARHRYGELTEDPPAWQRNASIWFRLGGMIQTESDH